MKKNWTTRLMAGIAAGTMVFSLAGCGSSSDGKKSADKEKFIVGFDAAFPPYGYQDENGEYVLLNGNQTLVLLMTYQLTRWAELGRLNGHQYVIKTIVTTEMVDAVADYFKVKCYECLTGFKYIAKSSANTKAKCNT